MQYISVIRFNLIYCHNSINKVSNNLFSFSLSSAAEGISDKILLKICQKLGDSSKLFDLAVELGVEYPQIRDYRKTNHMHGEVTTDGTRFMLFSWRESVSKHEQHEKLHAALTAVGLLGMAEYLKGDYSLEYVTRYIYYNNNVLLIPFTCSQVRRDMVVF